jgi:leucyl-tRNA synthetase
MAYDHKQIDRKWQTKWDAAEAFKTESGKTSKKPKYYALDMFPYPSGYGLHVGHLASYTPTDVVARYKRAKGFNVLHPMGYDAFGLPAEEYAIRTNTPPRVSTENNIANFTRQLKMLGFSYDWDRCLSTTDVDYFKWTQF